MENKEIRRANLLALAEEFGTLKALAEATGTVAAHLTQIKGRQRAMGEDVARRIEAKLGKPPGWMDAPPDTDTAAQQLLQDYSKASPSWQLTLRLLAKLPESEQPKIAETVNQVLVATPTPGLVFRGGDNLPQDRRSNAKAHHEKKSAARPKVK